MSSFYTFYARQGNNVLLREKRDDGQTVNSVVKGFKPKLWVESKNRSEWTNIFGRPIEPIEFENIHEAGQHIKSYSEVDGYTLYGTKDFALDFVCQRYGKQPAYNQTLIRTFVVDIEVKATEFPKPEEAKFPIDLLTIYDNIDRTYYVFSLYDFNPDDVRIAGLKLVHRKFNSEIDLLREVVNLWAEKMPDNYTGWNTEGFDTPYLFFRITKMLGKEQLERLSPFGKVDSDEITNEYGQTLTKVNILGVPDLDYLRLYKKHTYVTRESYRLDFIGQVEGVGRKIQHDEDDLFKLAENDPQTYQVYNITDVNIVVGLDSKLKLLDVTYALSYLTSSNYVDTLGTTKQWQNAVYSHLLNKKQLPFVEQPKSQSRAFPGGFVKDPISGKYRWVASFDFASLYPHLIMHQNLGPETWVSWQVANEWLSEFDGFIEYANSGDFLNDLSKVSIDACVDHKLPDRLLESLQALELCMAPNGSLYRKNMKSFFSEMMSFYYNERKAVKKKMLKAKQDKVNATSDEEKKKFEDIVAAFDAMQMALKIAMNSGYGAISNEHFLYFKIDVAEAITTGGQTAVRWVTRDLNTFMNTFMKTEGIEYDLYQDTDSTYLNLEGVVNRFLKTNPNATTDDIILMLDNFCAKILQPVINDSCNALKDYLNAYEQKLEMKREVIAESAIWSGKKRYCMAVWDSEGVRYKEPELKVQGLESVRSSVPQWSRDYLEQVYECCLTKSEPDLHKLYKEIDEAFHGMAVEKIAVPTGVSGILKYTGPNGEPGKGCQIHIRAAIYHNRLVRELGLNQIGPIDDKEKIKYLILKPNPRKVDVIAFRKTLPAEFGLAQYVDKQAIFEKSFLKPAQTFVSLINWNLEHKATLDSLFD